MEELRDIKDVKGEVAVAFIHMLAFGKSITDLTKMLGLDEVENEDCKKRQSELDYQRQMSNLNHKQLKAMYQTQKKKDCTKTLPFRDAREKDTIPTTCPGCPESFPATLQVA